MIASPNKHNPELKIIIPVVAIITYLFITLLNFILSKFTII